MNYFVLPRVIGMAAAMVLACAAPSYANVQSIYLNANQSYYLGTQSPIVRVAVVNPNIADVVVIGGNALNIVAKDSMGTTTVNVWTKNGIRQEFRVVVSETNDGLADTIKRAINLPHVEVHVVKDRVLLTGYVENQYEKELAFKVACLYVGDDEVTNTKENNKRYSVATSQTGGFGVDVNTEEQVLTSRRVINMLQMMNPDQINIEAMVIEVNSNDAKKLGFTYGSPSVSSSTDSGIAYSAPNYDNSFYAGESFGSQRSKGSHWYDRNWLFTHFSKINTQINAMVEQGKARVISRPNITTMSGKPATILVGGEVPYPTVDTNGNVTVEYKPYGISLQLNNPTVDREGNVTSDLTAIVSRLDWANAVTANGYSMPALTTRTAATVVNIPSGMTMAIGGLLNSEDSKTLKKVPLLGDIPILGELFKYHDNSKQKSEIMILITPRVVNENTKVKMSAAMEKTYNDMRSEDMAINQVDLNAPPKKKAKQDKGTAAKVQENQENIKERIAKYLAE